MIHIKSSNKRTSAEVKKICDYWEIQNYEINGDLTVDVYGSVDLDDGDFDLFPVCFGYVKSNFSCRYNRLETLIGSPMQILGTFDCTQNKIMTLDGCPRSIQGKFILKDNPIVQILELWRDEYKKGNIFNRKVHQIWDDFQPVEKHGNNYYLNESKFQKMSIVMCGKKIDLRNVSLENYIIMPEKPSYKITVPTTSGSRERQQGTKVLKDILNELDELPKGMKKLDEGYYLIKIKGYKNIASKDYKMARYYNKKWSSIVGGVWIELNRKYIMEIGKYIGPIEYSQGKLFSA